MLFARLAAVRAARRPGSATPRSPPGSARPGAGAGAARRAELGVHGPGLRLVPLEAGAVLAHLQVVEPVLEDEPLLGRHGPGAGAIGQQLLEQLPLRPSCSPSTRAPWRRARDPALPAGSSASARRRTRSARPPRPGRPRPGSAAGSAATRGSAGPTGRSAGPGSACPPGTASGRPPAPKRCCSAGPAPSPGTSGRSSPGSRGSPARCGAAAAAAACRTWSRISIVVPRNGVRPVSSS